MTGRLPAARLAVAGVFLAVLLVGGLAVVVLASVGGNSATIEGLPDAGPVTRWALPFVRGIRDVAATLTIGPLFLVAALLPRDERSRRRLTAVSTRAVRWAGAAAALWFCAGLGVLILTYSDLAGAPITGSVLSEIPEFVHAVDIGRSLAFSCLLVALVVAGSLVWPRTQAVEALLVLAFAALWPLASTGHAADGTSHQQAVMLMLAHLIAVTIWVGGLAAFGLLDDELDRHRDQVLRRYSLAAATCFAVVAVSGVLSAALRLDRWADLATPYGVVLAAKTAALAGLGLAGVLHRKSLNEKGPSWTKGARRRFARLAVVELIIMAAAMGLAVALARTSPPASSAPTSTTAVTDSLG